MRKTPVSSLVMASVLIVASLAVWACAPKAIELSDADDGSAVELAPGQQLEITLEANPTTGYRWDVDGSVPIQLTRIGEPEFTPSSSAIGAGGTERWTFAGAEPGEGSLTLKYWRSFEPTVPPIRTYAVDVEVR